MQYFAIKSLSRPFPYLESLREHFLVAFFFGVFTFLFLIIFEPFAIGEIASNKIVYVFGYGAVTFTILFLTLRLFNILISPEVIEHWTVGKMLLLIGVETFLIAVGNWSYSYITEELYIEESENFWTYIFYTFSIGLIPITFFILYLERKLDRKNQGEAQHVFEDITLNKKSINKSAEEKIAIIGVNTRFTVPLDKLLCIKAFGNYVEVYYLEGGLLKKELIRQSLNQITTQLKDFSTLKQCHRSYIVNFNKIEKVSGNARNFNLHLPFMDFTVPVSRNFPSTLIKRLFK